MTTAVASYVQLGGYDLEEPCPGPGLQMIGLRAGLPGVSIEAVNPDVGVSNDVFGLGWEALLVDKGLRSGGKVVVDQALIDSWREENSPVLLDFGAGP